MSILSKAHQMFYDETGLEISPEINRALVKIIKQLKIDKEEILKSNIATLGGLKVIESEYLQKGVCVIGKGQTKD